MTDHPITPPPELVQQWYNAIDDSSTSWNRQLIIRAALAQPEPETSRLRYCDVHGQQPENAWGCPECVREMRHQLAQPEPQGVSDEEIRLFVEKTRTDWIKAVTQKGLDPDDFDVVLARAALARWGRPAIEPVLVSERLPEPEDCDGDGRCWFCTPSSSVMDANWVYRKAEHRRSWDTHWAPHWALPVPGVEGGNG